MGGPSLKFHILGPVSISTAGHPVPMVPGHRRLILAVLLAAEGSVVTTHELIEALWGARPPPSARKTLQSHISRLRRELANRAADGAAVLRSEADGYRIVLHEHALDAAEFVTLVEQAREVNAISDNVIRLLRLAEDCWHGPAFGDLGDHPALQAAARRLEAFRDSATADRIEARLDLGHYDTAVRESELLIARNVYDERAHGQFMRALAGSGRQSEALSAYTHLRTRLADELGIDPSVELQRLYENILRQQLPNPISAAPMTEVDRVDGAGTLFGREKDLQALVQRLEHTQLLTLTGPGGVGKTRLAEHLVSQVAATFRDGVVSCALAQVRDPDNVGGALVTALDIQPTSGQTVNEALQSALADRHLLVLLDNCEHVLDVVVDHVHALLAGCPQVKVVATSRERLRLGAEHLWHVTPLDVPDAGATAQQVAATSAGALFQARAAAVNTEFDVHDEAATAVGALCRRLDGMPLAIELAAARTRALSVTALVERLDQRFAVLAGGSPLEGGRHRTLEAVVRWSYDLLASKEAELFNRLSVFVGPFSLTAVEAVCADNQIPTSRIADLLSELVDKSMVGIERTTTEIRYRMLETMRDFASEQLAASGDTTTFRKAHGHYYAALAETNGELICGPSEPLAIVAFDAAFDDLRAAHTWGVTEGDVDVALRIPAALSDDVFYRLRDEVTSWARRATELPGAEDHPAYPAALVTAAMGATSRDECDRADRDARRALLHTGTTSGEAVGSLGALATVALYEGRLEDTLELARRQSDLATSLDDHYHRAFSGICRVLAHVYRGEHDQAVTQVHLLHLAAEASGAPTMRAFARYCKGEVYLDSQPDVAAEALTEALEIAETVHNQLVRGVSLVCLASLQGRRGQTDEALRLFGQVIAHWRRLGDHTHQLTALRNLIELLAHIGATEPAAILYGAVASGDTPSFGLEAQRLQTAWQQIRADLGASRAAELLDQGRRVPVSHRGDVALRHLAQLCGDEPQPRHSRSATSSP